MGASVEGQGTPVPPDDLEKTHEPQGRYPASAFEAVHESGTKALGSDRDLSGEGSERQGQGAKSSELTTGAAEW